MPKPPRVESSSLLENNGRETINGNGNQSDTSAFSVLIDQLSHRLSVEHARVVYENRRLKTKFDHLIRATDELPREAKALWVRVLLECENEMESLHVSQLSAKHCEREAPVGRQMPACENAPESLPVLRLSTNYCEREASVGKQMTTCGELQGGEATAIETCKVFDTRTSKSQIDEPIINGQVSDSKRKETRRQQAADVDIAQRIREIKVLDASNNDSEAFRFDDSLTRHPPTAKTDGGGTRGLVQRILLRPSFDVVIGLIIVADGFMLGLEAEQGMNPFMDQITTDILGAFALCFKAIFAIELLLRFYAFGVCSLLVSSGWARFDALLVLLSTADVILLIVQTSEDSKAWGGMTVLKILRLARLARAARFVTQFKTLWVLINGLRASLTSILWTFVLLVSITYTFAVLGMETIPPRNDGSDTSGDIASRNFGNFADTVITLTQVLTFDSIASVYRPLFHQYDSFWWKCLISLYFTLYGLTVSIALMNLMTAVMVEGSLELANEDKEQKRAFKEKRREKELPKLRQMFSVLDFDGSGAVNLEEIYNAPEELKAEIVEFTNATAIEEIFNVLDDDESGSVQIDEFLEGLLKASDKDVMMKLQIGRLVRQVGKINTALKTWTPGGVAEGAGASSGDR